MQVPDIDDAMAQAVDIGENDVSIAEYIRSFPSASLFRDVIMICMTYCGRFDDRTRKRIQKKQKKTRKFQGIGVS